MNVIWNRLAAQGSSGPTFRCCSRANSMHTWPGVEPHELQRPVLVYTGTNDGNVIDKIEARRADIEAAGVRLHIFDGLNQLGLVSQIDTVLPRVLPFLRDSPRM